MVVQLNAQSLSQQDFIDLLELLDDKVDWDFACIQELSVMSSPWHGKDQRIKGHRLLASGRDAAIVMNKSIAGVSVDFEGDDRYGLITPPGDQEGNRKLHVLSVHFFDAGHHEQEYLDQVLLLQERVANRFRAGDRLAIGMDANVEVDPGLTPGAQYIGNGGLRRSTSRQYAPRQRHFASFLEVHGIHLANTFAREWSESERQRFQQQKVRLPPAWDHCQWTQRQNSTGNLRRIDYIGFS